MNNTNLAGAINHPQAVDRSKIAYANCAFVPNDPTTWLPDNIALDKPASASHGSTTAAAAVDGSLSKGWSTGQQAPANTWPCIDLGLSKPISRVKLSWVNVDNRAKAYRVQVSTNNVTRTDASVQVLWTTGAADDLNFPAKTGRYVRVFTQAVNGNPYCGYGIQELKSTRPIPPCLHGPPASLPWPFQRARLIWPGVTIPTMRPDSKWSNASAPVLGQRWPVRRQMPKAAASPG